MTVDEIAQIIDDIGELDVDRISYEDLKLLRGAIEILAHIAKPIIEKQRESK